MIGHATLRQRHLSFFPMISVHGMLLALEPKTPPRFTAQPSNRLQQRVKYPSSERDAIGLRRDSDSDSSDDGGGAPGEFGFDDTEFDERMQALNHHRITLISSRPPCVFDCDDLPPLESIPMPNNEPVLHPEPSEPLTVEGVRDFFSDVSHAHYGAWEAWFLHRCATQATASASTSPSASVSASTDCRPLN